MENINYKPYYLKIIPTESNSSEMGRVLQIYTEERMSAAFKGVKDKDNFGVLTEILSRQNWSILKFDPISQDVGFTKKETPYKRREDALSAAQSYFKGKGYEAKEFDLESIIDKI